ncbi:class I SAM-dependent RNA methyltransferase [Candidatus Peregrinibacteria bacterium]|nr:class I SAM-dependent RNA methyltransferase [Candidatus Peregrinibacteria bacterium]
MIEPKCPYFNVCGGCATQHLPYKTQLENKVTRLMKEIEYDDIKVFSDNEWNYRNRMDMTFTSEGIGFREKGKWWKTIPVSECAISNQRLNELNKEICDFFGPDFDAFNVKSHEGTYKYAVIRTPQNDSSISIVLNKDSKRLDEAIEKVKEFAKKTTANNVLITYCKAKSSQSIGEDFEVIKGSDMLEETIMGKVFHYSAQGFFQNNSVMAEKMHEYVHNLLKGYRGANGGVNRIDNKPINSPSIEDYAQLLDLYGGVGAFGIINADLFHKVISVESFEGCTTAANANIKRNNLTNVEAICMDAARLKQVKFPQEQYIITDPPRSGMSQETIIEIKKLKPKVLIYISCNVEQLGKDLPKLKDYKIKSAAIFDLFPQTNHMESVIELVTR